MDNITIFYIFASIFAVSAVSVFGILFLLFKDSKLKELGFVFVSLSIGALLGGAIFHLLPEAFNKSSNAPIFILLGIFTFLILENIVHWHHSHKLHAKSKEECKTCKQELTDQEIKPVGFMILFSDSLHNIIDGALIASAFLISKEAGLAATLAVLLHEVPQEISDFGLLLHSGFSKFKAVVFNFLSALTAFLGAIFILLLKDFKDIIPLLGAFTAGSFLFIALSDLVPEMKEKHRAKDLALQLVLVMVALFIMYALKAIK